MDRKQMCVANVKYKKPTPDDAKRTKNLLKYLTYRDSRDGYVKQRVGIERWVDHGMGGSVGEIAERCEILSSEHVLTFSLVINPNPELSALVPPQDRERFVRELTEQVVDNFFDARGLDTGIEYSYVTHHRHSTDPQSPGLHDPHTHVVLPGTVYDEEHGGRVPLFFSQNRKVNHIEMLHRATEHEMAVLMERYVGRDWEQRYDALEAVRTNERKVVSETPHALQSDEEGVEWDLWCGTRRTDEVTTAVGHYRYYPAPTEDEPDAVRLEFRPLVAGLPHDQAEVFAQTLAQVINGNMNTLNRYGELIQGMSATERAVLVEQWLLEQKETREREISFDLEL